jgi:hypothetical protein
MAHASRCLSPHARDVCVCVFTQVLAALAPRVESVINTTLRLDQLSLMDMEAGTDIQRAPTNTEAPLSGA